MKVLVIHNDLRVYWRNRIHFLRKFLLQKNIELYAVELFGKGSPYDFESFNKQVPWWDCLFPESSCAELTKYDISGKVFAKLDEIQPDVVIGGSIVFYSGALGLRWAKRNGKKFIMFDDAKPSWVKRNFVVQGVKNLITRQIDALWLPSDEYDKEYEVLYSKKNIRYLYGYDCIDNEFFNFQGRKKLDHKKIISVSRLVPKKNIQGLLNAWQFVEANDDTYRLVILGDGPLGPQLREQAETLGLKRVDFVGAAPNEQIPQYLFEADAFISPSHYESWGLVVNEAMAAGLPVLLSDKINAAFTLLKNGENGYLFNPYNEEELKQVLLNFIRLSPAEKAAMSERSLELIGKMDYNYMGAQLIDTLNYLSKKPQRRTGLFSKLVIGKWYGRYNTAEWDVVKTVA